ncbi:hypothetical protein F4805DRAFT_457284 [Annulohypoxylon moriforme]|nr:hypothetical protein F4805DRAFT_457284 [Annulohypoxylon moriforme]
MQLCHVVVSIRDFLIGLLEVWISGDLAIAASLLCSRTAFRFRKATDIRPAPKGLGSSIDYIAISLGVVHLNLLPSSIPLSKKIHVPLRSRQLWQSSAPLHFLTSTSSNTLSIDILIPSLASLSASNLFEFAAASNIQHTGASTEVQYNSYSSDDLNYETDPNCERCCPHDICVPHTNLE